MLLQGEQEGGPEAAPHVSIPSSGQSRCLPQGGTRSGDQGHLLTTGPTPQLSIDSCWVGSFYCPKPASPPSTMPLPLRAPSSSGRTSSSTISQAPTPHSTRANVADGEGHWPGHILWRPGHLRPWDLPVGAPGRALPGTPSLEASGNGITMGGERGM